MTKIASKTYISILLGEKTPNHCRIEGRAPTLFIEQTEARRAEKNFFETTPLPYLRAWGIGAPPPPSPTFSEGLDLPLITKK